MKLLADVNIAPRTVAFLRTIGHDVVRVPEVLDAASPDERIVEFAHADGRTILTQDLDFSAIVALSGRSAPSVITLRLPSARIEAVNDALAVVLPQLTEDVDRGVVASFDGNRLRRRLLPLS